MTDDEIAQVEAFIAAGKMQRIPAVPPEDASVDGMIREIQARRKAKKTHIEAFVPVRLRKTRGAHG